MQREAKCWEIDVGKDLGILFATNCSKAPFLHRDSLPRTPSWARREVVASAVIHNSAGFPVFLALLPPFITIIALAFYFGDKSLAVH